MFCWPCAYGPTLSLPAHKHTLPCRNRPVVMLWHLVPTWAHMRTRTYNATDAHIATEVALSVLCAIQCRTLYQRIASIYQAPSHWQQNTGAYKPLYKCRLMQLVA